MKKPVAIMLAIILLAVIGAAWYLAPKTFGEGVDPAEVDHIEVFDGHTGFGFTIDNPEDISFIVENIQGTPMKKEGVFLLNMGYWYQISYIDENGKAIIPLFFIMSDSSIKKRPFFYSCSGGLCVERLQELEILAEMHKYED